MLDTEISKISAYFTWTLGRGFIPREGVDTNSDLWRFYRHQFIYCMSQYLFSKDLGVNDPVMEFKLAKKLFIEVFGEEIQIDKKANNTINTYLKTAQLLYRGEINWLENKRRLSVGITKNTINKLYSEKIDQEDQLKNIYETRLRPERYEKSITQLEKEFDSNQIKRLQEIRKLQFTNPILYDRLYRQVTEFKFEQITKNIDVDKQISEVNEVYLTDVMAKDKVTDWQPIQYEEMFDDNGNQTDFGQPEFDPQYYHQYYGIANPVIHDADSLKAMDYNHTQIDLKLFPYCFPRPHYTYPIETHQEVSQLFYSLRQNMFGTIQYREGSTEVPKTQLRASFTYEHHRTKFLHYMRELEASFPNYKYTLDKTKVNNNDGIWSTIWGKFYRIPIFENESYDPDNWEMETTDKNR